MQGNLEIGIDGYYKIATDLLDDGQFGQAYVLSSFNYAHAYNEGAELKVKYQDARFKAYCNLACAVQKATHVVSNRFLFDPAELAYIDTRYICTAMRRLGRALLACPICGMKPN